MADGAIQVTIERARAMGRRRSISPREHQSRGDGEMALSARSRASARTMRTTAFGARRLGSDDRVGDQALARVERDHHGGWRPRSCEGSRSSTGTRSPRSRPNRVDHRKPNRVRVSIPRARSVRARARSLGGSRSRRSLVASAGLPCACRGMPVRSRLAASRASARSRRS
jgi:hypothetical protein